MGGMNLQQGEENLETLGVKSTKLTHLPEVLCHTSPIDRIEIR